MAFYLYLVVLLATSAPLATSGFNFSNIAVKEHIDEPPQSWKNLGLAPPDHILHLRIALPQSDFAALERHLYQVSDPAHERYGAHLTREEVEALVKPKRESVNLVEEWLTMHGVDIHRDVTRSPAGDWLNLALPVGLVEIMLHTTYHVWTHDDGSSLVRTTEYSLPAHLNDHIQLIQPTTMFSRTRRFRASFIWDDEGSANIVADVIGLESNFSSTHTGIDPGCRTRITVSCLKQIYNAVGYNTTRDNGNQIAVTGYLEEFANKQDLHSFFAQQRSDAIDSSFKEILINGGLNSQNLSAAGPEASLDVQFAFGLTFPTPATFYSTGGRAPFKPDLNVPTDMNEPYLDWLDYVLSHPNVPQTISTSYGDEEQTVPKSYALRVCQGYAQLGARGVSLLFGSGDGGVGGVDPNPTQLCTTNDGRNATRFIANFPASCPFVTAVGATQGFAPEVATTRFGSGGGFSDYFQRPAYADEAVASFFEQFPKDTYAGLFNPEGAPIPDVSAQGDLYLIFLAGVQRLIGGASAATPTFASIISMLNDARINAGKPPLGWLNPMLYSKGFEGLNDILVGNNPGCGTQGFNCTRGWDPITGLGTPDFAKLKTIVMGL
ncbi:tripeptidyl peptidase A [Stereum hirsutum FP-91666 SS1]|uniref:tripeptidyl peptidase A n=1 Tax=Stereum hirsutum (strain FP-91666) TaxID=721885 RepID=UPI00044496C9|nr:tripeptidyl peptidase A [Stereum hirsutum FP-91666 SS1]EIM80876.1 tripeptidyl peptidase A [Stereum hirsutum FP-91666 SS1]